MDFVFLADCLRLGRGDYFSVTKSRENKIEILFVDENTNDE